MRIVIAQDSAVIRAGLVEILADRGHETVAAVGDADALRAAVDEHEPDAAVVDVRMPPGYTDEGVRAAIAIRRDHPRTGAMWGACASRQCPSTSAKRICLPPTRSSPRNATGATACRPCWRTSRIVIRRINAASPPDASGF